MHEISAKEVHFGCPEHVQAPDLRHPSFVKDTSPSPATKRRLRTGDFGASLERAWSYTDSTGSGVSGLGFRGSRLEGLFFLAYGLWNVDEAAGVTGFWVIVAPNTAAPKGI